MAALSCISRAGAGVRLLRTVSVQATARVTDQAADASHGERRGIRADAFDVSSIEQSCALVGPTFGAYYAVLADLLGAGVGVIAERNFHRGVAERDLRPLAARACTVIVHCQTARAEHPALRRALPARRTSPMLPR